MKTPPLLLLAVLLFWGWQSGLLLVGAIMGLVLESARFVQARWDLSDDDFRRILSFCTLLAFTVVVYVFAANEPGGFGGGFHGAGAVRHAAVAGVRTSTAFFRWLPVSLFLLAAAQAFSAREKIPWTAISLISRRRARRAQRPGEAALSAPGINVTYPYFMVCLFSSSIHANAGGTSFFWGQCALILWALWPFRSRRFGVAAWAASLAAAIAFGFFAQGGISQLQGLLEGYNAQWLARFLRQRTDPMQATTAIGHIGRLELSGRIVIRLWTDHGAPPPTYLREASYRIYSPETHRWKAGVPRNDFQLVSHPHETNQTSWVLLPGKTNTASARIACYLNGVNPESGNALGLLPLPPGVGRLDNLNAYVLQKNGDGAVLAEGPGLLIFDARYGAGTTMDAPPDTGTNALDLTVPADEKSALDQVISRMKISGTNEMQTLQAVYGFFQDHFTYSVWQGPDKLATTNETPLARFLLTSHSGHCEYFATATVLLLRELGIPARYAIGYAVHEASGRGYVVRQRDAHAWCLVWNRQTRTWDDFDTTPASWIKTEAGRASPLQWFSDFWSWIGFQISKLRWGETNLRQYIFWGLVPVLAFLLYQIVSRRERRRRARRKDRKVAVVVFRPGLDSEFYRLEQKLAAHGAIRQPGEPLSPWLQRATDHPDWAALREPVHALLTLHYRHRFDPQGLNPAEREALRRGVENCLAGAGHRADQDLAAARDGLRDGWQD